MAKKNFSEDTMGLFDVAPLPQKEPKPVQEKKDEPMRIAVKPAKARVPKAPEKDRMIQRSIHIKESQYRALKMRAASGVDPADKDISAIVRRAIDMYLSSVQ